MKVQVATGLCLAAGAILACNGLDEQTGTDDGEVRSTEAEKAKQSESERGQTPEKDVMSPDFVDDPADEPQAMASGKTKTAKSEKTEPSDDTDSLDKEESEPELSEPESDDPEEQTAPDFREAVLPSSASDSECSGTPPPSVCEWAGSVDAILRARVSGMRPLDDDFLMEGDTALAGTRTTECDAVKLYGVVLELENTGTLFGQVPDGTVEVRVGSYQLGGWHPTRAGEPPTWNLTERWPDEPLAVGTVIGVALSRVDGRWALLKAPPFTFDESGTVKTPLTDRCTQFEQMPDIGGRMNYDQLVEELSSCQAQPDLQAQRAEVYSDATYSVASTCFVFSEE